MKLNDWIVAGLTNPDTTTSEFLISGLNIENTQLLSPDQYKKSSFVRDRFTENGVFNEDAFDTFYKLRVSEFGRLLTLDVQDTFLYNPLDPRAAKGDKNTMSPGFGYELVANPNKEVNFFGSIYANDYSQRERAQRNKVFDVATGTWSEDTLNDNAFINSPSKWLKTVFGGPLVYATYDEDGEHYDTFRGGMVKHSKGQYRLDAKGNPYTETLNGRSLIGKDVVAAADILTVDKEGIDKYNFFDSDDVEKSVTGTIMKTVAAVAPMLMGPYVAGVYSGLLVGRELLKTLPMLYGITTAWFDMPEENATLNKLAAYGNTFTTSMSDYGRSKMVNTEVVATLLSDVALQWGLQLIIAKGVSKLRGSKNLMQEAYSKARLYYGMQSAKLGEDARKGIITKEALEKYIGDPKNWLESAIGKAAILKFTKEVLPIVKNANRLGADASLAYMALVSNTDVYSSMLEAGASRKEAAAVALGSTIGMFGVDKYLHLGELFFDDLTADYERQVRRIFTKEAKNWYENVIKQNVKDPEITKFEKFRRLFQSGVDFGKKHISQFAEDLKYHSTGFVGKALGEGLEEVSEELVADVSKGIYELMGDLGLDTTVRDVGAFDNALARYGMSFLGGTLGGGLFYGVNLYLNGKFHVDQTQDELIYLVRNGKTDEALKTLDEWRNKGKLGNTSLSTEVTKDSDGNDVFVTANSKEDSQNEFIYKRIKETILSLENVINENRANLNEDLLFENMILSEVRFKDLQKYLDKLKSNLNLQEFSYTTGYLRDYQKALSEVINLELSLKLASRTKSGLPSSEDDIASDEYLRNMTDEESSKRNANIKMVQELLKDAKDELNRFLSGEYSIDYSEKMLFALDNHLNENFVAMTYDQWLKKNHAGKTPDSLSPSESEKYKEEYLEYKKAALSQDLDQKFAIYKAIKELMNPILLLIQEGQENFKKFLDAADKLSSKDSPIFKLNQYSYDDVLDFVGETEESDSYINRNLDENRKQRLDLILDENKRLTEVLKNSILQIIDLAGGFIDPITRRKLKLLLFSRNKDHMRRILQNLSIDIANSNTEIDVDTGKIVKLGVLSDLDRSVLQLLEKIDVKNLDEANKIWDEIDSLIKEDYLSPIISKNRRLGGLVAYLSDAPIGQYMFQDDNIYGSTLKEIIDELVAKGLTLDQIFDTSSDILYSQDFESYGISDKDLNSFLEGLNIRQRYEDGTLDSFEWLIVDTDEALNDTELLETLSKYNQIFRNYLTELSADPAITLNEELDARISNINPVIELVKSLGLSLNTNMENLEKILTELDKKFEETEDINDLILASEEKESFEEAAYILKLAKSYLYAASATPNIISPFGHNATLNEFAEHHKDIYKDYKPLPVLSSDVAAMYEHELSNYLLQMGVKDEATGEYNAGSWMWVSNTNESNKAQMFIRADKAWSKASYDVFAHNPDSFKFTYDGKEYDLLEGFETIPPVTESTTDALVHLNKLFNLFHNNVNKLIKEGWTYKQIWERSGILEKLCGTKKLDGSYDLQNVILLKTTALNEHITFDRMTGYDKMVFLTTVAAMDSTKFYSYLKTRVEEEEGIVPLTILEWVSRVGIALIENSDIFNQTLEYIQKQTGSSLPIIYNAVYMGGNAGAGKK